MLGMRISFYSKKRRVKRMGSAISVQGGHCRNKEMISVNQEDKIHFIKDGLSKESLDDII